jgi:hypothetical protein
MTGSSQSSQFHHCGCSLFPPRFSADSFNVKARRCRQTGHPLQPMPGYAISMITRAASPAAESGWVLSIEAAIAG